VTAPTCFGGVLVFAALAGCVGDASTAAPVIPWRPVAAVAFGADDVSAPFTLRPRGAVTFVRVTGAPLANTCVQLQSLDAPDGTALVDLSNSGPSCTRCRRREATALGAGVFALPTNDAFSSLTADASRWFESSGITLRCKGPCAVEADVGAGAALTWSDFDALAPMTSTTAPATTS
jgi:hypothetical protein